MKHLDGMARPYRTGKRIDGLTWVISQRTWYVCDDFGYGLTCERQDEGTFVVKGVGPAGDGTRTVKSVRELRDVAKQELNPAYT